MKKAANHRRRHPPPGPCGVWFQTQRQLSKDQYASAPSQNGPHDPSTSTQGDEKRRRRHHEDMSFSPAWTAMQQSLDIVTPYLPIHDNNYDSPKRRYELLRPHVPSTYVLLWEILNGQFDFTIEDPHRLLVLVHSVEAHIHHNIWTVQLQDETGTMLRAWLEPKFVQSQMQLVGRQPASIIRTGVVWMLCRVSMIVVPNQDDEEKVERLLLVSGAQIEKVWTPEDAETNDEQAGKDFLNFMERRKVIQLPTEEDGDDDEEGPDGPPEEEGDDIQQAQQQRNSVLELSVQDQDDEAELDHFTRNTIGGGGSSSDNSNMSFPHGGHMSQPSQPSQRQQQTGLGSASSNTQSQSQFTQHSNRSHADFSIRSSGGLVTQPPPLQQTLQEGSINTQTQSQYSQNSRRSGGSLSMRSTASADSSTQSRPHHRQQEHQLVDVPNSQAIQSQNLPSHHSHRQHADNNQSGGELSMRSTNAATQESCQPKHPATLEPSASARPTSRQVEARQDKVADGTQLSSSKSPHRIDGLVNDAKNVEYVRGVKRGIKAASADTARRPKKKRERSGQVSTIWTTQPDVSVLLLLEEDEGSLQDHDGLLEHDKSNAQAKVCRADKDEEIPEGDENVSPRSSIFDPCNLEGVDPNIFSEQDEDEGTG